MWTHILIGIMACVLLAKQVKNDKIDLGFLPQLSLSGLRAIEMLKDGTETGLVYKILSGTIGNLAENYDIPIEPFKLDVERAAYLVFWIDCDRPLLVYQPSAVNEMTRVICKWNSESKISGTETVFNPITEEPIGVMILSLGESPGDENFGFTSLSFDREKGKKFGKYLITEC